MSVIDEVLTDSQMLYTKKDVVALLEKLEEEVCQQHDEEIEVLVANQVDDIRKLRATILDKACSWLNNHTEEYISERTPRCMTFGFLVAFKEAMMKE